MVASILSMLGLAAVIAICGYLMTLYFAKDAGAPFLAGCSFPMGASYYVVFYVIINSYFTDTVSNVLPLAALLAAGIMAIAGGARLPRRSDKVRQPKSVYGTLSLVAVLSVLRILRDQHWDTAIHFLFSSEIAAGKFPPSLPGTFDTPFPYHYGYDTLFGAIAALTGGNFIDVYILISVLFEVSTVLIVYSIIHAMTSNGKFAAIGTLIVMLGTGVFGFLWHEVAIYYRLFDILQQHPWKFAAFLVLLICAAALKREGIDRRRLFVLTLPLLAFAGYLAGQAIPFIYAGVAVLYGFTYFTLGDRSSYRRAWPFALLLTACAAVMLSIGGVFESDEAGKFTAVSYTLGSIADFFRNHDMHHGAAGRYYFFDTMFALIGYVYAAAIFWRNAMRRGLASLFGRREGPVSLLVAFGLFWYLSPMFLRMNITFYDNFCKFNYVGVIVGMLCFVYMAYRLYTNLKYRRAAVAGLTIYILCLIGMQVGYVYVEGNTWKVRADLERYREMIRSVGRLDASEGFVTYGIPEYVAFRLGVNLQNPPDTDIRGKTYKFHPADRYEYLPHSDTPDIGLLTESGVVRYIVAANDAVPAMERMQGNGIRRIAESGSGFWAIYEIVPDFLSLSLPAWGMPSCFSLR